MAAEAVCIAHESFQNGVAGHRNGLEGLEGLMD